MIELAHIMIAENNPIIRTIVYIAELEYERDHGRFPVGYYKARREKFGAIRQEWFIETMARECMNGEKQCVE